MGDASAGRFRLTGHSSHFSPSSASLAVAAAQAAFQSSQVAARTPPSHLHLHLQKVFDGYKVFKRRVCRFNRSFQCCECEIHPEAFQTSSRSPRFLAPTPADTHTQRVPEVLSSLRDGRAHTPMQKKNNRTNGNSRKSAA